MNFLLSCPSACMALWAASAALKNRTYDAKYYLRLALFINIKASAMQPDVESVMIEGVELAENEDAASRRPGIGPVMIEGLGLQSAKAV